MKYGDNDKSKIYITKQYLRFRFFQFLTKQSEKLLNHYTTNENIINICQACFVDFRTSIINWMCLFIYRMIDSECDFRRLKYSTNQNLISISRLRIMWYFSTALVRNSEIRRRLIKDIWNFAFSKGYLLKQPFILQTLLLDAKCILVLDSDGGNHTQLFIRYIYSHKIFASFMKRWHDL